MSKDPCERCCNNQDGIVNIRNCCNCACSLAESSAFVQLVKENNRLHEEARLIDKTWADAVMAKMAELEELLRGKV